MDIYDGGRGEITMPPHFSLEASSSFLDYEATWFNGGLSGDICTVIERYMMMDQIKPTSCWAFLEDRGVFRANHARVKARALKAKKLEKLMAPDVADPDVLKHNVVRLLLSHPQGIKLGDFSGAFYKLHGHHPQLALHGYSSLKNLLTGMKNMVVLEENPQATVIKLARGVPFNHWLGEGEGSSSPEEEWEAYEEEMQSLMDEEAEGETDLLAASVSARAQPVTKRQTKQAPDVFALIQDVVRMHPHGLKMKELMQILRTKHGFNLVAFSFFRGYEDALACLQDIPGLFVKKCKKAKNCVVYLQPDSCGSAPSLDTDFSACDSMPQKMTGKQSVLAAALLPILHILQDYPKGLDLQMLSGYLKKRGFDLERFSQDMGYDSTIGCLLEMPGLHLTFLHGQVPHSCVVQLLSSSPGLPAPKVESALGADPALHRPSSSSAKGAFPQPSIGTKRAPTEVLALISNLLNPHLSGLRVKKLQELLLNSKGFDLEKFSIAHGYKDTLEFLEHQMPELKITYREGRLKCVVKQASCSSAASQASTSTSCDLGCSASKPKASKKNVFGKEPAPAEVLALPSELLKSYKSGLRVKKLEEYLLNSTGFDLEKFSIAHGYKDTLEFLEHQMPELQITYRECRHNCVVKQGKKKKQKSQDSQQKTTKCPGVKSALPLPNVQPRVKPTKTVEPPKATPDLGGVSKPSFREATQAGPGASALLQNGICSSVPVPSAVIPNHPSSKEQQGASSGKDKSSSQPPSDIPAHQSSTCQLGGQYAGRELSHPTYAQALSKSGLAKPSPPELLDEVKQQVAHILAMHPEGMSLFQFRAAYSTTYQHHLPLGNASSAKQRLVEMSDIVCMKGYGVQTLLLPLSREEPPTKPGPPVFSGKENAAAVLADSVPKPEVRPAPAVVSRPSLLKTPVEPLPHTTHLLASDHLRKMDLKNSVLPKGQCPTTPKLVAPLQEPVRPKVSFGGPPDSSEAEEAAMKLGNSSNEAVVKIEPVVVPKSGIKPSLSKAAATPVPHLHPFVPSTSPGLRAPGNKESSVLPESLLPRPPELPRPRPSVPVEKSVRARAMPGENLLVPHSPVVFPEEPQVPTLNRTSNSLAFRPMHPVNPAFTVNIPVPSLFQPVVTNIVAMSQPVVYPPLPHLLDTPANPSFSLASYQSVSRTQLQRTELVRSHLTQPASPNRPAAKPTSPIQHMEQTDRTRATEGLDPLWSTSRTQGPGHSPGPGFSADGHAVSSPSVKPPSFQPLNSPSAKQPDNVHHTWLNSMPCSSVPAAIDSVAAAPSAGVHSKPVVPAHQKQYDAVSAPVAFSRTPSSCVPHQPAASFKVCPESDTLPSKPLVSMPQPRHIHVNSPTATSNAQPPILLHRSQGSPIGTASQPSCVSLRPATGYGASHQSKPLPGISSEGYEQDSHHFTLPGDQMYRLTEEPTQPCVLQNSPPRRTSDNCVIL